MFTASTRRLAQHGRVITLDEFLQSLQSACSKWQKPMPKRFGDASLWASKKRILTSMIGIAVSGGVDSMALAGLCINAAQQDRTLKFKAFVVDHRLRDESTHEATVVERTLISMGLESEILVLPETDRITDGQHIERRARQLRYAMIGAACRDHSIETLLVAHHADDQAETVLTRLINNYLGMGLRGIQSVSTMSGETARYGVHQSGQPRTVALEHALVFDKPSTRSQPAKWLNASSMLTEAGGVNLVRPLLQFSKSDLIATCVEARIPWVEDRTNKDVSLATRNTLRYMEEEELLPQALQVTRLQALSSAITEQRETYSAFIEEVISQAEVLIDTSCSRVICTFPASAVRSIQTHPNADHIRATLLHQLLSIVVSKQHFSMNMLSQSTARFLQPDDQGSTYQEAGVGITGWLQHDGAHSYEMIAHNVRSTVEAAPMIDWTYDTSRSASHVRWSDWQLWEGRYWLRLGYRANVLDEPVAATVRYRRKGDDEKTSARQPRLQEQFRLHKKMFKIPKAAEYAMPVITAGSDDEVVAFPTYGISTREWALVNDEDGQPDAAANHFYMIRYKQLPAWATEPLGGDSRVYQQTTLSDHRKLSRSRPFPP